MRNSQVLPIVSACLLTICTACGTAASPSAKAPPSPYTKAETQSIDPGTAISGKMAPDFTLTNQFGKTMTLSQFRGKVVVLAFIDTTCTNICPLTTETMTRAVDALGSSAAGVQLLGVNANPLHTAVANVKSYSVAHGLENRWFFLTGTPSMLKQVWKNYGIFVDVVKGNIDHTPALFLIGPKGQERRVMMTSAYYGVVGKEAHLLAKDIASLLPKNSAKITPPKTPSGLPILSPKDKVTLPSLLSQSSVTLGDGKPHLAVFFASWNDGLAGGLEDLETYARAAKNSGLPPPVAIDVATTEPSLASPRKALKALKTSPSYAVAVDASGRVADAYGVQDLPWLVLVSAKGQILWHHDGFVNAPTLIAAVRQQMAR